MVTSSSQEISATTWSALSLLSLPVNERVQYCPPFLVEVIKTAQNELRSPLRIYIYGSRARGDNNELSDYDLAFDTPNDEKSRERWLKFIFEQDEKVATLLDVDWLWIPQASVEIIQSIKNEGVILHDG